MDGHQTRRQRLFVRPLQQLRCRHVADLAGLAPLHAGAHRRQQAGMAGALGNECINTGQQQHFLHHVRRRKSRHHQQWQVREISADSLQAGTPLGARHLQINHREVKHGPRQNLLIQALIVVCLKEHMRVANSNLLQHQFQPITHECMVIGNQDLHVSSPTEGSARVPWHSPNGRKFET